jgi:hypothetical protein
MSEIDWSTAPEDATHWQPENSLLRAAWIKKEGWQHWFRLEGQANWVEFKGALADLGTMIQRPAESPVPWSGEGLPPVGTLCEVMNSTLDNPDWERCTILFMGKFKAVYESESCHERVADVSESWMIDFRPIRTPEQIAAEERQSAIDEMWSAYWHPDVPTAKEALGLLYDAGYRKLTP